MTNSALLKSLAKIGAFSVWSLMIVALYYKVGIHSESFDSVAKTTEIGFFGMSVSLLVLYGCYKGLSYVSGEYKKYIGIPALIGYFFLVLLTLCLVFMGGSGMVLFFKIVGYLILPMFVLLVSAGFGQFLMQKLDKTYQERSEGYKVLLSTSVGVSTLLFFLAIFTGAYLYSIWSVSITIAAMLALSYKESGKILTVIWKKQITLGESFGSSYTLLSELFFLILALLVSANFINIVRPMPIGWDDLGAYMNYPKTLAENGGFQGIGVIAWQSFTAMGFLFRSAPQAFFFNQVGGIITILFLTFGLGSLIKIIRKKETTTSFAPLPLIGATIFMGLPMVVFEQAKDMKLDPALFAISSAVLFCLYELLAKKEAFGKNLLIQLLAIGFVAGTAFALKATSLMLFIALAGLFFYEYLSLVGFLGFFAVFIGLFTKLKLWGMMNVVYPQNNEALLSIVGFSALGIGVVLIAIAFFVKVQKELRVTLAKNALIIAACFLGGTLLAFSPWLGKNVYEIAKNGDSFSVINLLSGHAENLNIDFNTIRTDASQIKAKVDAENDAAAKNGTTTNEDFGRYLGYESGINNHLRLPYNLTLQKNQQGEYTDISCIFLALLPAVFIFLPFSNIAGVLGVLIWLAFWAAYFVIPGSSTVLSNFFGQFELPVGYIPLAILAFAPLIWAHFTLNKEEETGKLFVRNLAFLSTYSFIFVIAAFGVVWYGIALYACLLVAIIVSVTESNSGDSEEDMHVIKATTIFAVIGIILIYLLRSAVPHAWSNISSAGFEEFKNGKLSQNEAVFAYHPDYLNILATLNQKDPSFVSKLVTNNAGTTLKTLLNGKITSDSKAYDLDAILKQIEALNAESVTGISTTDLLALKADASKLRAKLYTEILYPSAEDKNSAPIYRIGTFLTYFISDSRYRYFDDSLVSQFYTYFYDENRDTTVERISKSGLKYFLVDLNAATIDRDPRHNLTTRFESLLDTFPSDKLQLIQTDSICLRVALDEYKANKISEVDYRYLAGVNHESYGKTSSGEDGAISRSQKLGACQAYIVDIIKSGRIDDAHFSYLKPISQYVSTNKITTDSDIQSIVAKYVDHGWLALFAVKN